MAGSRLFNSSSESKDDSEASEVKVHKDDGLDLYVDDSPETELDQYVMKISNSIAAFKKKFGLKTDPKQEQELLTLINKERSEFNWLFNRYSSVQSLHFKSPYHTSFEDLALNDELALEVFPETFEYEMVKKIRSTTSPKEAYDLFKRAEFSVYSAEDSDVATVAAMYYVECYIRREQLFIAYLENMLQFSTALLKLKGMPDSEKSVDALLEDVRTELEKTSVSPRSKEYIEKALDKHTLTEGNIKQYKKIVEQIFNAHNLTLRNPAQPAAVETHKDNIPGINDRRGPGGHGPRSGGYGY